MVNGSPANKDQMGQEMFRLLKIFGLASLGLVLLLSLFNERRANNTGEDPTFRLSDSGLLFFKNIRRIDYAVRGMAEANIDIYTHKGFEIDSSKNALVLEIIVHKNKNAASLYLLQQGQLETQRPLLLKSLTKEKVNDKLEITPGNRYEHLNKAKILFHWLSSEMITIEAKVNGAWIPILKEKKEKEAFVNTYKDFLKITSAQ